MIEHSEGHPEAAGILDKGSDQGRDLLGSGEIVPRGRNGWGSELGECT